MLDQCTLFSYFFRGTCTPSILLLPQPISYLCYNSETPKWQRWTGTQQVGQYGCACFVLHDSIRLFPRIAHCKPENQQMSEVPSLDLPAISFIFVHPLALSDFSSGPYLRNKALFWGLFNSFLLILGNE